MVIGNILGKITKLYIQYINNVFLGKSMENSVFFAESQNLKNFNFDPL